MRIVYFGTPVDAVAPLHALAADHDVAFVVTQPDRRRGRGAERVPSPVKLAAESLGLRTLTPERSREVIDDVRESGAEVGVVVAFGQILPEALLSATPLGFVNLHFSLLPRWRGAAPVERAILAGDAETGVAVMAVVKELDAGPVFAEARTEIRADDTAGTLHARLVQIGTELLLETLPDLGSLTPREQAGESTYAAKLAVEEFAIDWSRPARVIDRVVRAANPRPGAFTEANGRRLKVWRTSIAAAGAGAAPPGSVDAHAVVATGDGALVLDEVQPEGKPRMPGTAWRAGVRGDVVLR